MKPTIGNAFNAGVVRSFEPGAQRGPRERDSLSAGGGRSPSSGTRALLASMQADLRQSDFGWSLELNPIQALDAAASLQRWAASISNVHYLVTIEQSGWRRGERGMALAEMAAMLETPVVLQIDDQLVVDASGLSELARICQPTRLLVVAVEGAIEERDARAMNRAIEGGASPLTVEMRALAAIEVLGDRSLVLHCRDKAQALNIVAENFRPYLAALRDQPTAGCAAPDPAQIERLIDLTGALTVRPIETEMNESSIDVGVNTSLDRFIQPAAHTLVYDIPSDTWHDEPA